MSPVSIHSEIGALRRVLVHRPGEEIVRMTAEDFESLLFVRDGEITLCPGDGVADSPHRRSSSSSGIGS